MPGPTLRLTGFDFGDGADVVFGREDKLVVQHPFRLAVEAVRGMQLHHLVVLDGKVVPGALEVRHLQRARRGERGNG